MIELMLQAERNLAMGLVEPAERLYRQVLERDPKNAIAVVGLARVAIARADDRAAYALAIDALRIDPQNAAAIKLEGRLAELFVERGESFEREPFAVRLAEADSERAERHLRATASTAPAPSPGRPDYAPTPGSRFEQVATAEAAHPSRRVETPPAAERQMAPEPTSAEPTAAAEDQTAAEDETAAEPTPAAPETAQQPRTPADTPAEPTPEEPPAPGLLQRLFGRGRSDK